MSIEICFDKAKEKFRKGEVDTIRISFVTCRTNELMKGMNSDFRNKAMSQANIEADKLNL